MKPVKWIPALLSVICAISWSGCSTHKTEPLERRAKVSYYDRNGDGQVDQEKHNHPGVADADWELRDDDFDGNYEKKILYGVGVFETVVSIPVPTHVRIEEAK